jgi:nucleoside-diphosphate-sugar epimerase
MVSPSDRILITGSGGLTGRALCELLRASGGSIFGLTRQAENPWEIEGDLTDRASLRRVVAEVRPTVVVHLAGVTYAAHGDLAEIYQTNVTGVATLLDVIQAEADPRAVILASSATVYAAPVDGTPIRETGPLRPGNHYGASKLAMEHVARLFAGSLPIVVTRPFNYTGEGQSPQFLVPKIVQHFARHAPEIELGNLDLYRDFSDVGAVAEIYRRLIDKPPIGATLNICSGRPLHLASILDTMAEIAGYRITVNVNPAFMRGDEPIAIVGSTELMDRTVGVVRSPPFPETLRRMYDAARAANALLAQPSTNACEGSS